MTTNVITQVPSGELFDLHLRAEVVGYESLINCALAEFLGDVSDNSVIVISVQAIYYRSARATLSAFEAKIDNLKVSGWSFTGDVAVFSREVRDSVWCTESIHP